LVGTKNAKKLAEERLVNNPAIRYSENSLLPKGNWHNRQIITGFIGNNEAYPFPMWGGQHKIQIPTVPI